MFKPLLLVPAVLLFGYTLVPIAALSQASGQKSGGESPAHIKKLYEQDCSICHGATGDGKTDLAHDMGLTLADWTNPASLTGKSDQELFDMIRKGKDKMPPEDPGRAKNDEVHGLVTYIRSLSKGNPSTVPALAPAAAPPAAPSSN